MEFTIDASQADTPCPADRPGGSSLFAGCRACRSVCPSACPLVCPTPPHVTAFPGHVVCRKRYRAVTFRLVPRRAYGCFRGSLRTQDKRRNRGNHALSHKICQKWERLTTPLDTPCPFNFAPMPCAPATAPPKTYTFFLISYVFRLIRLRQKDSPSCQKWD
jgi:hypothetical protein